MDEFDKVEKLRQRANVSFEEARDALRACDGDLLDAMVYLERLGHVKAPEKAVFSTNADEKKEYENVPDVIVKNERAADPSFGEQLTHLLKTAFRKSVENYLVVSHRGQEKFRLPILVVLIVLLMFNFGAVIAIVISLFFDVRYSFDGKDDLSKVNDVMGQAGARATEWMSESYAKKKEAEASVREEETYKEKKETCKERKEREKKEKEEADQFMTGAERPETFLKQEVDELAKKYDAEDKKDK